MDLQIINLCLGTLALFLSVYTLWRTQLSPFKLLIAFSHPHFKLYIINAKTMNWPKHIKEEGWLHGIDATFDFHNCGKNIGAVRDIRFVMELETADGKIKEILNADSVVDYKTFKNANYDRVKWMNEARIRPWHPLILRSGDKETLHLTFEKNRTGRWKKYSFVGESRVRLEVLSSRNNQWVCYGKYKINIKKEDYEGKTWGPWLKKESETS